MASVFVQDPLFISPCHLKNTQILQHNELGQTQKSETQPALKCKRDLLLRWIGVDLGFRRGLQ
jgi:hypothetical protein